MFELKNYQQQALTVLENFLVAAKRQSVESAFEQASFRLPLVNGYFYPDFVAELHDGRLLVVEYKGDMLVTNDDSREKNAVGDLWAKKSGGRCLFLMAVLEDVHGRNVFQQLERVVKSL
ncbi:MAG: hypothetical protein Q8Q54_01880 [Methylococcales bacterium]|nr:hypothetical protein [Methylococcales bacterium]